MLRKLALFDVARRGFMRNTMTRPMCCAESQQPVWEYHLYGDDAGDGDDTTSVCLSRIQHVN